MKRFFALAAAPCVAALGLVAMAPPASAHHSTAMFDQTREVTLHGVVREFQWTNPHAYIQLMVTGDDGKQVEYSLEMGAPMYLYARGWRPRTLRPGSEVQIVTNPLRNGDPGGVVLYVKDMDGNDIGTNQ